MKAFSQLFERLDTTTSTNQKVAAMVDYFRHTDHKDAAWAVFFLTGRRLKRLIKRGDLMDWVEDVCPYERWMIEESYHYVGDLAETISLLVNANPDIETSDALADLSLSYWIEACILPLRRQDENEQGETVKKWWRNLPRELCFVVTKLLTGAFRVGVSQLLLAKAIAKVSELPKEVILHRLMGDWTPSANFYRDLIDPDTKQDNISRPYPFFLASPLEGSVDDLGNNQDWQAEWKWDGIRAQLIKRENEIFIWSRGEELITDRFPEVFEAANELPDGTVLDGELLAWRDNHVQPFSHLQKRIGRKTLPKKLLAEVPVIFLAYDIMEKNAQDIRDRTQSERRENLNRTVGNLDSNWIRLSPLIHHNTWACLHSLREESRERLVEGLMLKHRDTSYQTGRKRGDWWKWKVEPLTIDAVLLYAQAGHGKRAALFTDYTFGVWQNDTLLPVAKAYSGLSNEEIQNLDKWIRRNTLERFGPVRAVPPEHVFEIGFEGINASSRHKAGVALRFPRILRWRHDMRAKDANTLAMVKEFIPDVR